MKQGKLELTGNRTRGISIDDVKIEKGEIPFKLAN